MFIEYITPESFVSQSYIGGHIISLERLNYFPSTAALHPTKAVFQCLSYTSFSNSDVSCHNSVQKNGF